MMNKHISLVVTGILVIAFFLFQYDLDPFDNHTFIAHDETQAARVSEFALNIAHGQIPPRISPQMSFGMGYPLFNYYAPFAYWITSLIHLAGVPIVQSLELSYALALITALIGMTLFLKRYLSEEVSALGGLLYITSPFVAVDIFVRGNLAEIWFLTLLPLALFLLSRVNKRRLFVVALVVSFLFSVHNIFSLLAVGITIMYAFILKNKHAFAAIFGGLLLSSYFLIPALIELPAVHATKIANLTYYADHFVCPSQIWNSAWGFGGSTVGCEFDGMSFMLGKLHVLLALGGLLYLGWNIVSNKHIPHKYIVLSVAMMLIGSVFLTTRFSIFLWQVFEPMLSLFQFPWRFLLLAVFGIAFFGAYGFLFIKKLFPVKIQSLLILLLSIVLIHTSIKYFQGNHLSNNEYTNQFISAQYIRETAAFKVPEYLPISANYDAWRLLEQKNDIRQTELLIDNADIFHKTIEQKAGQEITLPIHNADYWHITSNEESIKPLSHDNIGRPTIPAVAHNRIIQVSYQQTLVEQSANYITLLVGIMLIYYSYLWNKSRKKI